jgi:hypothetical protein
MKNVICHSGGCPGSDMFWETEGDKYGVTTIAYSFYGHSQQGKNRKILERDELDEGFEAVKVASVSIGRSPNVPWPYVKNLICRNWFQVKNSEVVFAVGKFINRKIVSGGTGWAVQMGVDNKKPVFFFDQEGNVWNTYNYTKNEFEVIDYIPKLTQNFAGIGTRELQENGKEAIRKVYETNLKGV